MKQIKRLFNHSLCILLAAFMVSCKNKQNVKDTITWIEKAEKPIVANVHTISGLTMENSYTLIDAKGNIYSTGRVELTLPDTIIAR